MEDVIIMTRKEMTRYDVIRKAIGGVVTVKEAAEALGMSERQVKRLKKKVGEGGAGALIHGNKGRTPKHSVSEETKEEIVELKKSEAYKGSNFSHYQELLAERHGIEVSVETVRRILTGKGIQSPKTRRRYKAHRSRKRRAQAGMLVQTDATPYEWFLGDGTKYALHGGIDDATSQITGLYMTLNECMQGYCGMLRRTIGNYGVPQAIYADRHTIFQSPNKGKAEIDASVPVNDTQFGRCLKELGIQLIAARSPQAKGRIERLWGTLQSRLPVEFAANGITTVDAANEFLQRYVYAYNSRFAVEPEDTDKAFSKLPEGTDLDYILCVKEKRKADAGGVFSYNGKRFKVVEDIHTGSLPPGATVTVMASPAFGVKAEHRGIVYGTEVYRQPKPNAARAAKPKAPAKEKLPVLDSHPYKHGKYTGEYDVKYVETDAEVMDMLYDIFFRKCTWGGQEHV
jgi:transposase